ncbi:MAG TPA: hypothetical protein VJ739_10785, partial [Gemmataceae bacterium]|nr:hypothetical protein [Gemmataceae bacterium]
AVTVTSAAALSELPVAATGGRVLSAIESVDTGNQPLATFTDPAGAEALGNYSATIDWHDGTTSAGVITYDGAPGSKTGVFTVLGSHAFHDGSSPPVSVIIHHSFAPDVTVTSSTSVTPVLSLLEVLAGPIRRAGRNRWVQTVQILNLTGFPLSGHFVVVLDGLGVTVRHGKPHRTGVRLRNPTGFTPGPLGVLSPFVAASFGPGALNSPTGGVFVLQFSAPPGAHVQYAPRLEEGTNVP